MKTIQAVRRHTGTQHILFVADDGSTDDTVEHLAELDNVIAVSGSNRGIAWNKNRVLYYLHAIRGCDVILMLEDDTFPSADGWERDWVDGAVRYGHLNLAPTHWNEKFITGDGSVANPFVSSLVTGQCSSFSGAALDQVGYLDTRFRRYGLEHAEHTFRLVAAGYGGVINAKGDQTYPFLIRSPLIVTGLDKAPDMEGVRHNGPIFEVARREQLYRHAWRTDEELAILRAEMLVFQTPGTASALPVLWRILSCEKRSLVLTKSGTIIAADDILDGRILLEVVGRQGRLAVEYADGAWQWLLYRTAAEFEPIADYGAATVYDFVSAPGPGFGLRLDGRYLCNNIASEGRIEADRTQMSVWETFYFRSFASRSKPD